MKSFLNNLIILLVAGIVVYVYLKFDKTEILNTQTDKTHTLPAPEDSTFETEQSLTGSPATIVESTEEPEAATHRTEPLPTLEDSDEKIKGILSDMFDNDLIAQMMRQTGTIHRFVVTIDSLPKKELPMKYRLLPPTPGKFAVYENFKSEISINRENFARYEDYMQMFNKVDAELFVKWYTHFYPLIQEDYDSLGHKNERFNDRFIFVIDHLLDTPEAIGSIDLVQPSVYFKFADPSLQKLSAGQKILLRIGPANTAIVKTKLFKIRKALTAAQLDG